MPGSADAGNGIGGTADKVKILASCAIAASSITSSHIVDGAILNVDINASAAIALSKLAVCPLARSNHTGTQVASTISDFDTEVANNTAVTANTAKITYCSTASTKLATIETSATIDQTDAEIRTAVESATDSNVFSDADHTKLNAIEASATADQSNAEIKAAVEAATDSNTFTDADHSKLDAIEASATADQTNGEIKTAYEANACTNALTCALSAEITANTAKISYCSTASTKLGTIEGSATADQSNGEIKTAYEANSDTNALTDALSAEITANTAKTGISSGQASAITANTAKISYCSTASTKLGTIEGSATADQSNAEIVAAVEAGTDSNTFSDADHTKLNAIEACATADQSNAEIVAAVEAGTDSNTFSDADHTKLNAIAACANNYSHSTNANLTGPVTSCGNATTMTAGLTITNPIIVYAINAQTGTSYTPVLADAGKIITINNGSAIAVTIPPNSGVAYPIGSSLTFISIGAGLVTISQGSGVTIASTGGTATAPIITAQHNSATAIKIATDTWQVVGALT
jgi:hypothetical protein